MDAEFYVDPETGVSQWYDVNGNLVGIQDPGGGFVPMFDYSGSTENAIAVGTSSAVTDWPQLLQAVGGAVSAWQLNQINIARAQKGQAPINAAAYGPQVGVGLNQQTTNLIMYVAIGLGAVLLLNRKRG